MADIAIEFDGVIHDGDLTGPIGDLVPGILQTVTHLKNSGITISLVSPRFQCRDGVEEAHEWLNAKGFEPRILTTPGASDSRAKMVVSARGFRFDGNASTLLACIALGIPDVWTKGKKWMVTAGIEQIAQAHAAKQGIGHKKSVGDCETAEGRRLERIRRYANAGADYAEMIDKEISELQQSLDKPEVKT